MSKAVVVWAVAAVMWFTGMARGEGEGMALSVVTYNIRYDEPRDGEDRWDKRKEAAARLVQDHDPDLIGLQEALRGQLDDLKRLLGGRYAQIGVGRDDGKSEGEYSAILYRAERLEPLEQGTFWLSDTPEVAGSKSWGNNVIRVCTWARFREKSGGRQFYLFNTHLDHQSQASREQSAKLICRRIAERAGRDEPVIVTGDFNADEQNAAVLKMKEATDGPGLVDTYRVLHPDEKDVATFNDFGRGPGARDKIDYIFAQKGVKVTEAGIDRRKEGGRFPSDHYLVWAKMELPEKVQGP